MGYDASRKQGYVTYMETGRSPQKSTDACNTNVNRLYYNSKSGFMGNNWNGDTYKLTHIRPNF